MRLISGTCLLLLSLLGSASAQSSSSDFREGDNVVSLGIGLGSALGSFTSNSRTPALSAQFEHGQWEIGGPGTVSIGGYMGYKGFRNSGSFSSNGLSGRYEENWRYIILGLRSAYHYHGFELKNLDPYGGLMLSFNILDYSYSDNVSNFDYNPGASYSNTMTLSLYLGSRYYLDSNWSAFAELGWGISFLTVGMAYKL
jgi:hypothetical protein